MQLVGRTDFLLVLKCRLDHRPPAQWNLPIMPPLAQYARRILMREFPTKWLKKSGRSETPTPTRGAGNRL